MQVDDDPDNQEIHLDTGDMNDLFNAIGNVPSNLFDTGNRKQNDDSFGDSGGMPLDKKDFEADPFTFAAPESANPTISTPSKRHDVFADIPV
jgi:hypothetical protein